MAYEIRYDHGSSTKTESRSGIWKYQLILSVCLMLFVWAMKYYLPQSSDILHSCFVPSDLTATVSMAEKISHGATLRQGLLVFCQTVLKLYGG